MSKTLQQLIAALPGVNQVIPTASDEVEVTAVADDNRRVLPGHLFVAYPGVAVDGRRFIPDAVKRGAVAVVCEQPQVGLSVPQVIVPNGRQAFAFLCAAWHDFPSRSMVMIGVTGTDGKTTTTNLIYSMLKAAGIRVGMISTVNAVIGERVLDTGLHTTTPDADEVQEYLAQMRDAGMTHCVLEVTSHGLAQYRVDAVDFDIAVVTNITHEHLDLHGSYEAYRAAKARLFQIVGQPRRLDSRAGKPAVSPTAVLNADDSFSYEFLRSIPVQEQLVYSRRPGALHSVFVESQRYAPDGMYVRLATPRGGIELRSPLIGEFNLSNLMAAVCAALAVGLPASAIAAGAAAFAGVPGRLERIDMGQPFTAIVDFAHTPNALEQALRAVRAITAGRIIVVFGCAGERDVQKRPMMGRVTAENADVVVMTAEDPRREKLDDILDQMIAGVAASANPAVELHRVPDRGEAIRIACRLARPGDTVMACGKGHEQSMCFGTVETPWDDRVVMREAIRQKMETGD
ncbi:MAG: UDP-N-acetylmuramoyl-L-alanyl-D-glutamate--2,6-diaminopimelate ligase [Chloroflexi bacterium]|nr:UDP-N-acetylmuramoyl-L-alanyl-D-glutamate--2,6-diaminopimelate ligase [Chloroflexota bacterium]MCL5274301.1 UDP-N-acetylmuramoyl-L-alanyl-D-glutamate--2,6-diaminopimelate ligase [Chloroflexota bacterium]